jgi:hypothetical protein
LANILDDGSSEANVVHQTFSSAGIQSAAFFMGIYIYLCDLTQRRAFEAQSSPYRCNHLFVAAIAFRVPASAGQATRRRIWAAPDILRDKATYSLIRLPVGSG